MAFLNILRKRLFGLLLVVIGVSVITFAIGTRTVGCRGG